MPRIDTTRPCRRCGATVPVTGWLDITALGSLEPDWLAQLGTCPTEGCGTTCVTCRRPPGEVHGPHCWDRMRDKLTAPHIVDDSDCDPLRAAAPPVDTSWITMEWIG